MSIQSLLHLPKRFVPTASNEPPIPLPSDDAYKATLEAGIAQALEATRLARDEIEYAIARARSDLTPGMAAMPRGGQNGRA